MLKQGNRFDPGLGPNPVRLTPELGLGQTSVRPGFGLEPSTRSQTSIDLRSVIAAVPRSGSKSRVASNARWPRRKP